MMNSIVCGEAFNLVRELPDNSVDFVLWDPDYGVGIDYNDGAISRNEAMLTVEKIMPELRRVCRSGQAVVFWSGSVERVAAFLSSGVGSIWPIHYMGIWYKPNGAGSTGNGMARRFEAWF